MRKVIFAGATVLLAFVLMSFANSDFDFGVKKFVGVWEYEVPNAPYGYQNGTMTLTKEKRELKGTVSVGSYTTELEEIQTKKDELSGFVRVEGEKVQLKLTFDKDSFEGSALSSQGSMEMKGKRKAD